MITNGFICGPPIYRFHSVTFEYPSIGCPWRLRKNGELYKRCGKVFWKLVDKFDALSKEEQETYRIGGGCISF